MIDLTPLEVRKKKGDFPRSVRGYNRALVDDFLDLTSDRLEELVKENMMLAERLARIDGELADYKERERGLTEALVSAQELREEVRRQAEKDAELVRREAEVEASELRSSAAAELEREEGALRRVRARRAQLIASYRSFLEREIAELRVVENELEQDTHESAHVRAESEGGGTDRAEKVVAQDRGVAEADEGETEADWLTSIAEEEA